MSHTPGPWRVERGNVGDRHPLFVVALDKDGLLPWCDDDAHLIAAALELLAALKDLRAQASGRYEDKSCNHAYQCTCCWKNAIAAIAKAEGQEERNAQ